MTITELELRVATLEQKLERLAKKVGPSKSADLNGWIDTIHGSFENDSTYRQAAQLGRQWRKSHASRAKSPSRKTAGK